MESRRVFNDMVELPYRWVKAQMVGLKSTYTFSVIETSCAQAAGTARQSFAAALLEGNDDPNREYLIKMASASMYAGARMKPSPKVRDVGR